MGDMRRVPGSKTSWIRRDRSGCWNCKARKRKCPEEYPACSACVRRNLKCDYGVRLTWQDEAESLGIAFGRAGLKNKSSRHGRVGHGGEGAGRQAASASSSSSSSSPLRKRSHYLLPLSGGSVGQHWLNTTSADVLQLYMPASDDGRNQSEELVPPPPPPRNDDAVATTVSRALRTFPDLEDEESSFFLEYYIQTWSYRRVLTDKFDNPYRQIILPLCLHSQGLLDMVIAFASHDMRNNQARSDSCGLYHSVLLRRKFRSLRHVRAQLAASGTGPSSSSCAAVAAATAATASHATAAADHQAARDALLLIIMLQGLLEIANNSTREWHVHLRGALSTARHFRETHGDAAFSREVLEFASNCFSQQDVLSATAGATGDAEEGAGWRAEMRRSVLGRVPATVRDRSRVNGYTGLSAELLDIISSITTAIRQRRRRRRRRPDTSSSPPLLTADAIDLESTARGLQNRLQQLRQWSDERDPDNPANLNAAALHEAAWIYLRHGLRGEPVDSPAIQAQHLPRLLDLLRGVHRRRVHPVGSTPYPMWALFVAACVAQEDSRVQVMDWFVELRRNRPFSNVPITMAAVEAIWKKADLERAGGGGGGGTRSGSSAGESEGEQAGELVWEGAIRRLGWMMAFI